MSKTVGILSRVSWATWLFSVVSLWLTFQYRWVLDDAFIYFRYAENFAQKRQLVFNVGEYVEGYTSPLWMLFLAATRTAGLSFWPVVLGVSFASVLAFNVLLARINDAFCPAETGVARIQLPAALLCTNYAVLSHFGSGMETPLVQLCAAAFAYLVVLPGSRGAQVLLAAAPLVRPELALPFAVGVAWVWWKSRRFPWLLALLCGALSAGWLVFRVHYYGDLFPNTYYLKMGSSWGRGVRYLLDTVTQYHLHLWLIALFLATALVVRWRASEARIAERVVIWVGAGLVLVHVVRVGGDFVHYRYLAFPVCALLASFGGVAELLLGRLPRFRALAGATVTLVASLLMFGSYPHRQLPVHPLFMGRNNVGVAFALSFFVRDHIEDSSRHRAVDSLAPERWDVPVGSRKVPPSYKALFHTGWCAAAYDRMDLYVVHSFGLTSAVLARLPVGEGAQAGHKWELPQYAAGLTGALAGLERPVRPEEKLPLRYHPGRGALRAAARDGFAPPWIRRNLGPLERLEEKTYGESGLSRALGLALERPRIVL